MGKLIIIAFLLFGLCFCRNEKQKLNQDTISSKKLVSKDKKVIDIKEISGIWAENENENALFWIDKDSLFSVEHLDDAVKISIVNDTLIIYYDGMIVKDIIIKVDTDSLILLNEVGNTVRLYKRK